VYITTIANRNSPPVVLLRESYREQGRVMSRTLANLSKWPPAKVDALRRVLADEPMQPAATQRFEIERALGYGHVAAALGTLRQIGLDQILPRRPERLARLILAMIVARAIESAASPVLGLSCPFSRALDAVFRSGVGRLLLPLMQVCTVGGGR